MHPFFRAIMIFFNDKVSIMKTSRRLNLISDASIRFERGIDYEIQSEGLKRFLSVFESDQNNLVTYLNKPTLIKKKEEGNANLARLEIKGRYSAKVIAEFVSFPFEKLMNLNPQIEKVLATGKSFELILPKDKLEIFEAHKNQILQASIQSLYKIRD